MQESHRTPSIRHMKKNYTKAHPIIKFCKISDEKILRAEREKKTLQEEQQVQMTVHFTSEKVSQKTVEQNTLIIQRKKKKGEPRIL